MSVESTLPHGLKTSTLGSAYKVEYDQNLTLLDNDRITVGDVSVRPAFGVARRFWFDPTTKQLSYDDGTQWVEDLTKQSSLIIESLSTLNQDLTTDADVAFNSAILSSINVETATITGNINADALNAVGALSVTSPTSITLTVNSNDSLFIDSGGNVGIGTITPISTTKLHIYSGGGFASVPSATQLLLQSSASPSISPDLLLMGGDTSIPAIRFGGTTTPDDGAISYSNSIQALWFNSTRLGPINMEISDNAVNINVTNDTTGRLVIRNQTLSFRSVLSLIQDQQGNDMLKFTATENTAVGSSSILTGKTLHGGTKKFIQCDINGARYYILASTAPA